MKGITTLVEDLNLDVIFKNYIFIETTSHIKLVSREYPSVTFFKISIKKEQKKGSSMGQIKDKILKNSIIRSIKLFEELTQIIRVDCNIEHVYRNPITKRILVGSVSIEAISNNEYRISPSPNNAIINFKYNSVLPRKIIKGTSLYITKELINKITLGMLEIHRAILSSIDLIKSSREYVRNFEVRERLRKYSNLFINKVSLLDLSPDQSEFLIELPGSILNYLGNYRQLGIEYEIIENHIQISTSYIGSEKRIAYLTYQDNIQTVINKITYCQYEHDILVNKISKLLTTSERTISGIVNNILIYLFGELLSINLNIDRVEYSEHENLVGRYLKGNSVLEEEKFLYQFSILRKNNISIKFPSVPTIYLGTRPIVLRNGEDKPISTQYLFRNSTSYTSIENLLDLFTTINLELTYSNDLKKDLEEFITKFNTYLDSINVPVLLLNNENTSNIELKYLNHEITAIRELSYREYNSVENIIIQILNYSWIQIPLILGSLENYFEFENINKSLRTNKLYLDSSNIEIYMRISPNKDKYLVITSNSKTEDIHLSNLEVRTINDIQLFIEEIKIHIYKFIFN